LRAGKIKSAKLSGEGGNRCMYRSCIVWTIGPKRRKGCQHESVSSRIALKKGGTKEEGRGTKETGRSYRGLREIYDL